jgi:iron complex transport system ATP-binding protein
MERADVVDLSDRPVTEISGGERQRVILARSLATEAETILLDEPTASLDISHALEILDLCRNLAQAGKTVVLAIHDLNAAAHYAERAALLHNGRLVAYGSPTEVLTPSTIREVFGVESGYFTASTGESILLFSRGVETD